MATWPSDFAGDNSKLPQHNNTEQSPKIKIYSETCEYTAD